MHEFSGVRTNNYDSYHWKETLFGKNSFYFLLKILRYGIFIVASLFGQYGLSAKTMCSTKNNGMNPKKNTPLCIPRWFGRGWSSMLRLASFRLKPFCKVLTKYGVLDFLIFLIFYFILFISFYYHHYLFFVGTTIWKLLETRSDNTLRLLDTCCFVFCFFVFHLVAWGLSLVGSSDRLSVVESGPCHFLRVVFCVWGVPPHSKWACFYLVLNASWL